MICVVDVVSGYKQSIKGGDVKGKGKRGKGERGKGKAEKPKSSEAFLIGCDGSYVFGLCYLS